MDSTAAELDPDEASTPISVRPAPPLEPGGDYAPVIRIEQGIRRGMVRGRGAEDDENMDGDNGPVASADDAVADSADVEPSAAVDPSAARTELAREAERVHRLVQSIGLAVVEVLDGIRPVQQLARWLDPEAYDKLAIRTELIREGREHQDCPSDTVRQIHHHPAVRTVRVCRAVAGIYEASAVIAERYRARAIALRIERRGENWRISVLELG